MVPAMASDPTADRFKSDTLHHFSIAKIEKVLFDTTKTDFIYELLKLRQESANSTASCGR
jgi:hypothetical protein